MKLRLPCWHAVDCQAEVRAYINNISSQKNNILHNKLQQPFANGEKKLEDN